jgi:hypothetical protein
MWLIGKQWQFIILYPLARANHNSDLKFSPDASLLIQASNHQNPLLEVLRVFCRDGITGKLLFYFVSLACGKQHSLVGIFHKGESNFVLSKLIYKNSHLLTL